MIQVVSYNQLENTVEGLDCPSAHRWYSLWWASKVAYSKSGKHVSCFSTLKSFVVQSLVVWYSITKCQRMFQTENFAVSISNEKIQISREIFSPRISFFKLYLWYLYKLQYCLYSAESCWHFNNLINHNLIEKSKSVLTCEI